MRHGMMRLAPSGAICSRSSTTESMQHSDFENAVYVLMR